MSNKLTFGKNNFNFTINDREENDFYATNPISLKPLLENVNIEENVWECACGMGHLSNELSNTYNKIVYSSDLIKRCDNMTQLDFLKATKKDIKINKPYTIITNPPFKMAKSFVKKAFEISPKGTKICFLLKIQFLESMDRYEFFKEFKPYLILSFSNRIVCAMNGEFDKYKSSFVHYAWYVWEVGKVVDDTIIRNVIASNG